MHALRPCVLLSHVLHPKLTRTKNSHFMKGSLVNDEKKNEMQEKMRGIAEARSKQSMEQAEVWSRQTVDKAREEAEKMEAEVNRLEMLLAAASPTLSRVEQPAFRTIGRSRSQPMASPRASWIVE